VTRPCRVSIAAQSRRPVGSERHPRHPRTPLRPPHNSAQPAGWPTNSPCPILAPSSWRKGGKPRPSTGVSSTAGCPRSGVPTDRSSSVGWRSGFSDLGKHTSNRAHRSNAHRTGCIRNAGCPSFPRSSAERVGNREPQSASGENLWRALVRPGRKVAIGEILVFPIPQAASRLKPRFSSAANSVSACCASTQ